MGCAQANGNKNFKNLKHAVQAKVDGRGWVI
jgi:hypothetical protein